MQNRVIKNLLLRFEDGKYPANFVRKNLQSWWQLIDYGTQVEASLTHRYYRGFMIIVILLS